MEGCFTFQWGEVFFIWAGFIFKWGVHPTGRDIGFDVGGGVSKKIVGWGARPNAPHLTLVVRS